MKKTYFSVGICAFNEAKNIGVLLDSIEKQKLSPRTFLAEIIVVASGCTDETEDIVRAHRAKNKKIKLISQKQREGKAKAVNLFLKNARSKHLFLQSADTLPSETCYNYLITKLKKKDVGLSAGKVVPKNDPNTFLGFVNHLKWDLHHKMNMKYKERPKVGELIAFKKIFTQIPPETAVDEASIEPLVHLQGYKIAYEPRAIIYNQGPKTLREYLSGRRRIYAGHFVTRKKYAYEIITFSGFRILPVYLESLKLNPKYIIYSLAAAVLEIFARSVGYFDVLLKLRDHSVWKVASTSKTVPL